MDALQRTGDVSCSTSRRLASTGSVTGLAVTFETTGKVGGENATSAEMFAQPHFRHRHERGVERAGHVQRQRPAGARFLRQLDRPLDGPRVTADHGLPRSVEVGRNARLAIGGRTAAHLLQNIVVEAEDGGHGSRTGKSRLVHELAPAADGAHRIVEGEGPRDHVGAELAQRVSRGHAGLAPQPLGHDRVHGDGVREDRGLGVVRGRQLVLRTLPHDPGKVDVECRIRALENLPGHRERPGQIASHAHVLGPLPREEDPYHLSTAEAHVKPAPNAAMSTWSPRFSRPCSSASSSATGMVAELMLP